MKKKNWILPGLVAILVAAYFLMVGFSPRVSVQNEKSTCRSQKMKGCAGKINNSPSGEMFLDNISRQFLSVSSLVY
jgi:hypothetical protein